MTLPGFSVPSYRAFLEAVLAAGVATAPVEAMPEWDGETRTLYLRHDVDLHLAGIDQIAAVETALGAKATYFVLLTGHFNPAYAPNRELLLGLLGAGHRVGLHYDLTTYPFDVEAAWAHLDREVAQLSALVHAPVESICMHFPWGGREDIFRTSDRYVHPHAFDDEVVYVSDSCRAWRDETLLSVLEPDGPARMLLNTHAELWLGDADEDRHAFLRGTLLENTVAQHRSYVLDSMEPAWRAHPAPALHDAR